MSPVLRSFRPWVDRRSRVLILGSMPGPEALRRRQYYGFTGNHFWKIVPRLLGVETTLSYPQKRALLKKNRIALWDVLASCERLGALDSAIRNPQLNNIPALLKKYRGIRAVFINGRYAHGLFLKHHGARLDRPVFYLPSTSPANAAVSITEKRKKWKAILRYTSPL